LIPWIEKNTKKVTQGKWSLNQEFNAEPPDCEARAPYYEEKSYTFLNSTYNKRPSLNNLLPSPFCSFA
jgi:hypothetical protein